MEHVEKRPDFVWEIDCTTSSNIQRARNRQKSFPQTDRHRKPTNAVANAVVWGGKWRQRTKNVLELDQTAGI